MNCFFFSLVFYLRIKNDTTERVHNITFYICVEFKFLTSNKYVFLSCISTWNPIRLSEEICDSQFLDCKNVVSNVIRIDAWIKWMWNSTSALFLIGFCLEKSSPKRNHISHQSNDVQNSIDLCVWAYGVGCEGNNRNKNNRTAIIIFIKKKKIY